jgi:hypothetical protein
MMRRGTQERGGQDGTTYLVNRKRGSHRDDTSELRKVLERVSKEGDGESVATHVHFC